MRYAYTHSRLLINPNISLLTYQSSICFIIYVVIMELFCPQTYTGEVGLEKKKKEKFFLSLPASVERSSVVSNAGSS